MNKTTNSSQLILSEQIEFIIGNKINLYYPPILVIIGCIGNLIAFLVYSKKHMRATSTPIYLAILAIFDNLMLLIGLLQYWLLFNFYPKALKKEHCYGMFFVVNTLGNFTHWLIVIITTDRFIAVVYPMKRASFARPRNAYSAIIFCGVLAIIKNVHYIWTTDFTYHKQSGNAMCAFGLVRKGKSIQAYQWFETLVSSLIPFLVIMALNACIIYALRKRREKMRGKYIKGNTSSTFGQRTEERRLTTLLLIISTVFVILTCPLMVIRLYFTGINIENDVRTKAIYNLAHHIAHKLWYTNNGINFIVYSLFSKRFRNELWSVFRCKEVADERTTSSNSNPMMTIQQKHNEGYENSSGDSKQ